MVAAGGMPRFSDRPWHAHMGIPIVASSSHNCEITKIIYKGAIVGIQKVVRLRQRTVNEHRYR